jgi:hypothetical protein
LKTTQLQVFTFQKILGYLVRAFLPSKYTHQAIATLKVFEEHFLLAIQVPDKIQKSTPHRQSTSSHVRPTFTLEHLQYGIQTFGSNE